MKFGEFKLGEVKGGILAHSLRLESGERLRKGSVVDDAMLDKLAVEGVSSIIAALPETGDVLEDDAARRIAEEFRHSSLRFDDATTGRVNIFALENGVFRVSKAAVDAINALDPGITLATLADKSEVNSGRMVATIKIIPYAVSGDAIESIAELHLDEAMRVENFKPFRIGLVQTVLDGTKPSVLDKTKRILGRRLELSGSSVVHEIRTGHRTDEVAVAIAKLKPDVDLVILFGASANSDVQDVIPAGLIAAGGDVIRFGMPVDPGNLLVIGKLEGTPVIGAPGCARSPAENGFDWVLQQVLAGSDLADIDVAGMGVGGLLMETGARPHPRLGKGAPKGKAAAIILAAGQSRRMGKANKMTVEIEGKPMVRHVAEAALASSVSDVFVVTGHEPEDVKSALDGLDITYLHNDRFAEGLSRSLTAGIKGLPGDVDRALILLGDMPYVTASMINELLDAGDSGSDIVMSTFEGKRGNPVLWPRRFFEELTRIEGDTGARHVIGANSDQVVEVEIGSAAAIDLDTPEAVAAAEKSAK